jgi:predicted component of viral defense system (DUF524 family)
MLQNELKVELNSRWKEKGQSYDLKLKIKFTVFIVKEKKIIFFGSKVNRIFW